jgi:hypothetical protein
MLLKVLLLIAANILNFFLNHSLLEEKMFDDMVGFFVFCNKLLSTDLLTFVNGTKVKISLFSTEYCGQAPSAPLYIREVPGSNPDAV